MMTENIFIGMSIFLLFGGGLIAPHLAYFQQTRWVWRKDFETRYPNKGWVATFYSVVPHIFLGLFTLTLSLVQPYTFILWVGLFAGLYLMVLGVMEMRTTTAMRVQYRSFRVKPIFNRQPPFRYQLAHDRIVYKGGRMRTLFGGSLMSLWVMFELSRPLLSTISFSTLNQIAPLCLLLTLIFLMVILPYFMGDLVDQADSD